ncbi:hypothetical protein [Actinomadura sp. 3N508]|uniref:hypothetical protein n=1 Tax=Actinomadura sp. 3N508 TaxID=3375153 RepID=UPI003792C704
MASEKDQLLQVRHQYPGWRLWASRRGELMCATWQRPLTREEAWQGLSRTLIEDDLPSLLAKLQEQEAKRQACTPLSL